MAVAYERNFRWKIGQFRQHCSVCEKVPCIVLSVPLQTNALPSHIKINVSRNTVFEDSYHQVMGIEPQNLRHRLYIIFHGEEGLDYGGLARWVCKEKTKPHSLFIGSGFSYCHMRC